MDAAQPASAFATAHEGHALQVTVAAVPASVLFGKPAGQPTSPAAYLTLAVDCVLHPEGFKLEG